MWIAVGLVLGIASRIEERGGGISLVSTDTVWCAVAFLAARPLRAVLAITAANAGYYAYVAITQPDVPLAAVAGSPLRWVVLGVATGLFFGRGRHWTALAALLAVAGLEVSGAGDSALP